MKYSLIDMAYIPNAALATVEKSFELWTNSYRQELESRGLPLHEEDFWNCRILAVIENNNEIIGTHIYNSFDLRTSTPTSHGYFKDIPETTVAEFRHKGLRRLMSMEYLLVNPDHRGRNSPVRWGEVIIGLGFNVMLHSPWDGIVGIARADKKVNAMGMKMGCHEKDSLVKNQTPCRVMFMPKCDYREHEDPVTQNLITSLWENKRNWAGAHILDTPPHALKHAA